MSKTDIRDLSYEELSCFLESISEKPFRAQQIFQWIYQKDIDVIESMSNLSVVLKSKLSQQFIFEKIQVEQVHQSKDGTVKYVFQLSDKEFIETAVIPKGDRLTVCVSTQVGCKYGCRFCASGIGGWKRHLKCSEILAQILYVKKYSEQVLTNLVFMGVGEPLDNYDELFKAIRIINSNKGINIGARRITVSTCGLVPEILRLADEGIQIGLAISLHASNDKMRSELMPVNAKYPLSQLIKACHQYVDKTNRKITFEYILIKDKTCTPQAAHELIELLRGLHVKMNLIPYNEVEEFSYQSPSRDEIQQFFKILSDRGIVTVLRMPRGQDVGAACGQLRIRQENKK